MLKILPTDSTEEAKFFCHDAPAAHKKRVGAAVDNSILVVLTHKFCQRAIFLKNVTPAPSAYLVISFS
jgi:hypothetical protein